jgi:hypothetical protein
MKVKIIGLAFLVILLAAAFAAPVGAQTASDFSTALATVQQLNNQVAAAQAASGDAAMQAAATTALATAQTASSQLAAVQAAATDDATRSRASGLKAHMDAAIGSLKEAQTATGNQLASDLTAAKAEIEEALTEFPQVPATGEANFLTTALSGVALVGLALMFVSVGLVMRRLQPAR